MENSAYLGLPLFAGLAAGDIPAALAALDALCRPFAKGSPVGGRAARCADGRGAGGRLLIRHLDPWGTARCWARAAEASFLLRLTPFCPTSRCQVSVVAAERARALFLDPG